MSLRWEHLTHRYAARAGEDVVLRDLTLEALPGEITCLLGSSGSGKSTVLRLAAGLERVQAGRIVLDGETLSEPGREPPPERRPVGLVFQDHVLFPHKTVRENVAFGLRHLGADERREVAARSLRAVSLSGSAERYPDTLSGGEQQRVALARALAPAPRVLLLDEPFANVDVTLRRRLREDARRALRESASIAVVVTHDPEEALELGDRIAVLANGRIVQVGNPGDIWRAPADVAVAELFGQAQHLRGTIDDGRVTTPFGVLPWSGEAPHATVDVVVRPAAVTLGKAGPVGNGSERARVDDIRFLGDRYLVLAVAAGETLRASLTALGGLRVGDAVTATFDPAGTFIYPAPMQ